MTNIYIQQMKNIATAYYEKVCSLRKTIQYNSNTYSRDIADKYNSETEQKITNEANSAIGKINAVLRKSSRKSQLGIFSVAKIIILILLFLIAKFLIRKSLIFFYRNIIMIMLLCRLADLFQTIPNSQNRQALSELQMIMF